jgi:hypothetical protein
MVEAGKARLVGQEPSEAGAVCTFETITGERFSVAKLPPGLLRGGTCHEFGLQPAHTGLRPLTLALQDNLLHRKERYCGHYHIDW